MPLYEYDCKQCGSFESFISIQHYKNITECPTCDNDSYRKYNQPNIYNTTTTYRKARGINEKNQESPRVETIHQRHDHNHSHSHSHAHHHVSHTPWMVGH